MDSKRLDEIATSLDDIAFALEETQETAGPADALALERIRQSIDKATFAIDRLDNKEPDPNPA